MNDYETNPINVTILCITLVILGFFFFLFKVEACKHENYMDIQEPCVEEFVEFRKGGLDHDDHKCKVGATIELVYETSSQKPGVICRCNKKDLLVPSSSSAPATSSSSL